MAIVINSETNQPTPSRNPVSTRGRDGFFKTVYRFFDGLSKHRGFMIGTAVLLLVIGVGVGIWTNQSTERSEQAKSALFNAQKSFEEETRLLAGVKPAELPVAAKAANANGAADAAKDPQAVATAKAERDKKTKQSEDDVKKLEAVVYQKLDVDSKYGKTVASYREVMAKYPSTPAAFEARLGLGDLYYAHGEPAKAQPIFQEAYEKASGSFNKAVALSSVGYSLENQGKHADALAAFQKSLDLGENGLKGDLLLAVARSQEALKDNAKAKATYEQIITQLPNTEASRSAELYKAQL